MTKLRGREVNSHLSALLDQLLGERLANDLHCLWVRLPGPKRAGASNSKFTHHLAKLIDRFELKLSVHFSAKFTLLFWRKHLHMVCDSAFECGVDYDPCAEHHRRQQWR